MNLPLLLAVDDERGVRESVKMVFYKDYRLLEAESVDVAIRQVQEEKPQVVLLDVLMPKTDGIEILRQIKRIHPTCEVIMLTGVNSQQLAAKAMDFGAFDFIAKPFDIVELRQKVKNALEKIAQRNQP
ncbi:MAG TPA: response regulator [Candidatus Bathyarchaeia archaeon]|jgi:DNA-binding NtrC family response regulator|nr:response regulator [Candidatus Bathyarchaeia archaeon]